MMLRESELGRCFMAPRELTLDTSEQTLERVMAQVAEATRDYPGILLPQNPENLIFQFRAGRSYVIVGEQNPSWLAHGTIWPIAETENVRLGEIGTVMVLPEYRGRGLSKEVVNGLLLRRNSNELLIATTKDFRMAKAFVSCGLVPVDFSRYPATCQATCVCTDGDCRYRRLPSESTNEALTTLFESQERKLDTAIKCTLFISDLNLAEKFEQETRRINHE